MGRGGLLDVGWEGSREGKNESCISALGEQERGRTFRQMRDKGGGTGWGMKEGKVISLDSGVLSFLGDIPWRGGCTIGSHAFESLAHERGVGFAAPG